MHINGELINQTHTIDPILEGKKLVLIVEKPLDLLLKCTDRQTMVSLTKRVPKR